MQHDDEGAIGLILNRPTDSRLNDTLDFCEGNASTEDQVIHVGGPVDGPLMTLHTIIEYAEQEAMQQAMLETLVSQLVRGLDPVLAGRGRDPAS